MKIMFKPFIAFLILLVAGLGEICAQTTGVYCGGHIRREREHTYFDLKHSGFQYIILFNVNVETDGTLTCDGETVCRDGNYVFGEQYANDVKTLKQQPTSVSRIDICVGGWENKSYYRIKDLINANGTGSNTILYRNFKALYDALGVIDGVNNDDEHCYDVESALKFHLMMNEIGYKTSIAPYTNKSFWSSLAEGLGSSVCNLIMVQCYEGGAGNNPADWKLNGAPVHAGRAHYTNNKISGTECAEDMQRWKDASGAQGGFIWVYNDNTWPLNDYAARMNRVFGAKKASGDKKATVYVDADYSGYSVDLPAGDYPQSELGLMGFLAKDLSSLKVSPGYKITLFKGENLDGESKTFTGDSKSMPDGWNDQTRSIRVEANGVSGKSGVWKIKNRNSGKYLDLNNNSTDNDTRVIQYDEEVDDKSQAWVFTELNNGIYKIAAYENQNRGFDIHNVSKDNGAELKIYDYVSGTNQQFILYDKGDGWFQIIDRNSGKPIEVPESSTNNGEWVKIFDNNGSNTQQWALQDNKCAGLHVASVYSDADFKGHAVALSEGEYNLDRLKFFNIKNDDLTSMKVTKGYKILLYQDDNFGGDVTSINSEMACLNDAWNDKVSSLKIVPDGVKGVNGNYKIVNRNSGMYLDLADNNTENLTPVMQYNDEGDHPSQTWTFTEVENGVYKICAFSNKNRGLNVLNSSRDNSTQVNLYDYSGLQSQQFIVVPHSDGFHQIIDRNSGKPVEIPNSSSTLGEWLKIYDNNGSHTQQWGIEENKCQGTPAATLYVDINYGGKAVPLSEGDYTAERLSLYNFKENDLTSLKVSPGYRVSLYDGDNFTGNSRTYSTDQSFVGDDFNDKTSSLRIEKSSTTGIDSPSAKSEMIAIVSNNLIINGFTGTLRIFNIQGIEVMSQYIENDAEITLSGLSAGLYLASIADSTFKVAIH